MQIENTSFNTTINNQNINKKNSLPLNNDEDYYSINDDNIHYKHYQNYQNLKKSKLP